MRHAPAPPPAKTPEILLVDDNRQGLIARKSLLQELGYNIFTATSGDEALELLSKHNFDVVVTDFKMPRMDGVELIKRIRSAQAGGFGRCACAGEGESEADVARALRKPCVPPPWGDWGRGSCPPR